MLITDGRHVKLTSADLGKVNMCLLRCQLNVFMYAGDNKLLVYIILSYCAGET